MNAVECMLIDFLTSSPTYIRQTKLLTTPSLDISRLLRDRRLTLTDISDMFGFSSLSHFSQYLQTYLGGPRPLNRGSGESKNRLAWAMASCDRTIIRNFGKIPRKKY